MRRQQQEVGILVISKLLSQEQASAATAVRERATTFMNCSPSCSSSQTTTGPNQSHAAKRIEAVTSELSFSQAESLHELLGASTQGAIAICTEDRALSVRRKFLRRAGHPNQVSVHRGETAATRAGGMR